MRQPGWRESLIRRPRVESVEERFLMTAQPLTDVAIQHEAQLEPETTPAIEPLGAYDFTGLSAARQAYGFTGSGQTVVVIDSGIAYDHPALGKGFGAGFRVVGGWDFAENDANPYDDGPAGSHGTHVAGIIGSSDKATPGLAPGVDLIALRVFDDQGSGGFSSVQYALDWVHAHRNDFRNPITTVNLSIGSAWNSTTVPGWATLEASFKRLKDDGIFIAVAAGNAFTSYNAAGLSYPAASSYVVPVSSVDADGNLSSFSQRQERAIAAPGRGIRSTVPDYVGNLNGKADDFASYSGTSMAAPFVAGASVLLRQALQFVGTTKITEDTIYALMKNTADTIFDPVTKQAYSRLNLGRALDAIMPADDYGSTVATAYRLPTGTTSTKGVISRLDDHDYFTFTAAQSGVARLWANATGELRTSWELVEGSGTITGAGNNLLSVNVIAGQTYTIGLGTSQGLGYYTITAQIDPATVDLGVVDFKQLSGQNLATGERWFSVTASRTGIFTAEALFVQAGGNIDLELYDAAKNLLAKSTQAGGYERIDLHANAGDVFYVRAVGANSKVDFRFTNLVSQVGSTVSVGGTAGNDTFEWVGGTTHQLTVNGVGYSFASSAVKTIKIAADAGVDSVTLTGTAGADSVVLRPGSAELTGVNYKVLVSGTENIVVRSGGGNDRVLFYDSAGNDTLTAYPTVATLSGAGFANTAQDFRRVEVRGTQGRDIALLYDSAGDDVFQASPTSSTLYGKNYRNIVLNFDWVEAHTSSGFDSAVLSDSAGDDIFAADALLAMLYGPGYHLQGEGFDRVVAKASAGGNDQARLSDSNGNDTLAISGRKATMTGAGYSNQIEGFDSVQAKFSTGVNVLDRKALDYMFTVLGAWIAPEPLKLKATPRI